jgi:hypothetical protein
MSLMRLLTSGKSLVGLKDEQARYRMGHPGLLPNFGGTKNPFQTKASLERGQEASGTQFKAGQEGSLDRLVVVCGGREASKVQLARPSNSDSRNNVQVTARLAACARRCNSKVKQMWDAIAAIFKKAPSLLKGRARSGPFGTPAIQAELSLDQIRVARNDLAEAESSNIDKPQPAKPAREHFEAEGIPGVAKRCREAAFEDELTELIVN